MDDCVDDPFRDLLVYSFNDSRVILHPNDYNRISVLVNRKDKHFKIITMQNLWKCVILYFLFKQSNINYSSLSINIFYLML